MNKTKTIDAGPVGLKPKGAYSGSAPYTLLDCVLYNHDSWVCKAVNEQGEAIEITGQTPADGSQYWQALTDGGRAAYNEGETAKQKGNTAQQQGNAAEQKGTVAEQKGNTAAEKAALANEKAAYAQQQGDYAKEQAQRAQTVADQVVEEVLENLVFATPAECRAIVTNYR